MFESLAYVNSAAAGAAEVTSLGYFTIVASFGLYRAISGHDHGRVIGAGRVRCRWT
jgi:hypothetical protein